MSDYKRFHVFCPLTEVTGCSDISEYPCFCIFRVMFDVAYRDIFFQRLMIRYCIMSVMFLHEHFFGSILFPWISPAGLINKASIASCACFSASGAIR